MYTMSGWKSQVCELRVRLGTALINIIWIYKHVVLSVLGILLGLLVVYFIEFKA